MNPLVSSFADTLNERLLKIPTAVDGPVLNVYICWRKFLLAMAENDSSRT